ncbi:hypothetical protein RSOLAG1IB_07805 [Rhizoctonia solani AG-1 IB]|uniref:Uncharacterized protein n=1 Tax=Thanatephorus cucumeris (strain AG1-IB / isolate 7/3/14) TaxID=1108050 RepID=A0A0B7FHI6_THACB|nr:hypothetical protein RSOLAG1IB_07805 [Rhizoctonia solani AG-1 IB]
MSINQDVDLDGALQSPSRLSDFRTDHDSSSVVSWNRSPSLTFVFDDEEEDKSCVEMLIDIEDICESKNVPEWSDMASTSHQAPTTHNQAHTTPLELDASSTITHLSSLYPYVLKNATVFLPNKEYKGKIFAATRRRRSTGASQDTTS